MSTSAFILMILVQGSVIFISSYFFVKVLRMPSKPNNNSRQDKKEL